MTLPYFPLFPADFDADTGHLSFAEDGAYNRLLRLQWRCPMGKMPADLDWIFRKIRAITEQEQVMVEAIIKEFFTRKGGKIFSPRLLKEWVKAEITHEKKVLAGSKGAALKALKNNKTDARSATATLKQPEPEPEPEPELSLEKEEATASSKKTGSKGSRLNADWVLSEEWVDDALALGVKIEVIRKESDKFRDYWLAKPGKDGVKLDWRATWRNWIRRRVEDQRQGDLIPAPRPRGQQWGEVVR